MLMIIFGIEMPVLLSVKIDINLLLKPFFREAVFIYPLPVTACSNVDGNGSLPF